MTGRPPQGDPGRPVPEIVALPPSLRVAGLGSRLVAWVLDGLVFGIAQIVFWMIAAGLGAVTVTPEAQAQLETSPLAMPTVTPYQANLPLLAALLALFVVLNVGYAAVAWARFRALPGQRLVSLQVGSAATGRNLSLKRALARSVVAVGIQTAGLAGLFYVIFAMIAAVPWSEVRDPQPGGPADAWSGVVLLTMLVAAGWPVLLLVWTAASPSRQGLHDRLAGSLVVANAPWLWMPGAAPMPGFGPGYGPGYDPGYGPGYGPGPAPNPGVAPAGAREPENVGPEFGSGEGQRPGAMPVAAADATAVHPVTIGRRVAAYLFDCVVCLGFLVVASSLARAALPPGVTTFDERTSILAGLAGGLMQLAYFTVCVAVWQGTLGQRSLHIRVANFTTGKPLGWMDALARWAVIQGPFALSTIVPDAGQFVILVVAATWAVYLLTATMNSPDGRGPHDRFINSRVTLEP
jgi:hypothetical protein